jgi:hypothetical protein
MPSRNAAFLAGPATGENIANRAICAAKGF